MKKAIIITLAVLVLWFVGYKVFAKSEPKQECTDWCRITKDEFVKMASDEFSKKFDKIQQEKEEAKRKADEDAEMRLLRAIENVSVSTWTISTGFTK